MKVKIENLSKAFGDFKAVDNISLDIPSNQTLALLGVNGAGKTTTIKMLTGLLKKDSGKIFYEIFDVDKDLSEIKSLINISPQETAVADTLTVFENIKFIAEIYGFNKNEAISKTNEIISDFKLDNIKNKKAKLLSGGMKRRLSIAMSLVSSPKVLFLDEPTLGLDVFARNELWTLIKSLKTKMTIILTTHYMEEAEELADDVAIMHLGKIIANDSPKNLMNTTNTRSLEQAFLTIIKGESK